MKKLFTLFAITFSATFTNAQWSNNASVNNAICAATDKQERPAICSDGSGGAIMTWVDSRSGSAKIYAQRISANGMIQWQVNGIEVDNSLSKSPAIVADGAGGAIITWCTHDPGYDDVYAQRINASGVLQWTATGVVICNATKEQALPSIISDGSNGAIIVWVDNRATAGNNSEVYAQKVNGNGIPQWAANGVILSTSHLLTQQPRLVTDGASGAVVTWADNRNANSDIYAQRINTSGAIQWALNGVLICNAAGDQMQPDISTDGSGGALIAWEDLRQGTYNDIYAQHILSTGTLQWAANGLIVSSAQEDQNRPKIVADGTGGAIITWYDFRSVATEFDIYAQKVTSAGAMAWTPNGTPVCTASSDQDYPCIAKDGSGGAIISWHDKRNGGANTDIYAQRINSTGSVQWPSGGVLICSANNMQENPEIISDNAGGAIITWADYRNAMNYDIYAQRVMGSGTIAVAVNEYDLSKAVTVYPNPSEGRFTIEGLKSAVSVKVKNISGQVLHTNSLSTDKIMIDLSNEVPGAYLVEIEYADDEKVLTLLRK